MAVRGFEGFEHYGSGATAIAALGSSGHFVAVDSLGSFITTNKRTGTYAFQMSSTGLTGFIGNYLGIDPAETKGGLAMGWYFPTFGAPGNYCIMQFRNSSSRAHISLQVNALGRIVVMRGGRDALSAASTQIGISSEALQPGTFYHIETEIYLDGTVGYVKIRVNGREFYYLENVNTIGAISGDSFLAAFAWGNFDTSSGNGYGSCVIDDVAWWDSEVDTHHDGSFIGQHGVYWLGPISDGAHEEFLLTTGTDSFALLDELPPNGDTDYVWSDTIGQRLALVCDALPANVEDIECVMVMARLRKVDNGDCDAQLGVRTLGAVESYEADFTTTPTYLNYYAIFPTNPETVAPWNPAAMPQVLIERTL